MFFHKVRLIAVLIFALGTVMLMAPTVEAQTVHTLLVIMDDDKTLGRGMQVNLDKLNDLLKQVDKVYRVANQTNQITVMYNQTNQINEYEVAYVGCVKGATVVLPR